MINTKKNCYTCVLAEIGSAENPDALFGGCEIENRGVLEDLVKQLLLRKNTESFTLIRLIKEALMWRFCIKVNHPVLAIFLIHLQKKCNKMKLKRMIQEKNR
jgi:hypothetical protein